MRKFKRKYLGFKRYIKLSAGSDGKYLDFRETRNLEFQIK